MITATNKTPKLDTFKNLLSLKKSIKIQHLPPHTVKSIFVWKAKIVSPKHTAAVIPTAKKISELV